MPLPSLLSEANPFTVIDPTDRDDPVSGSVIFTEGGLVSLTGCRAARTAELFMETVDSTKSKMIVMYTVHFMKSDPTLLFNFHTFFSSALLDKYVVTNFPKIINY